MTRITSFQLLKATLPLMMTLGVGIISILGSGITLAQSPLEMMTDNSTIEEGIMNSNLPENLFKMGTLSIPIMCITPADILESVSAILENETESQMMKGVLMQEIMSSLNSTGLDDQMQNISRQQVIEGMESIHCMPSMNENTTRALEGVVS